MRINWICGTWLVIVASLWLACASDAVADTSDRALERDGALCTRQIAGAERRYGIPSHLLGAIAVTETGRRHKGLGIQVPWPWSINVEGAGYIFDSKDEAMRAVEKFRSQGKRSIDVGCMQVNLLHHPEAFASLNQAFEPRYNVDYAARFLRKNYEDARSWRTAVGYYHSRTAQFAIPYTGRVYSAWHTMTNRLNYARNRVYTSYIRAEKTGEEVTMGDSQETRSRAMKSVRIASTAPSVKQAAQATPRSKVIRVAGKAESHGREDLTIIRPATSAHAKNLTPLAEPEQVEEFSSPVVLNAQEKSEAKQAGRQYKIIQVGDAATSGGWTNNDSRFIRFND